MRKIYFILIFLCSVKISFSQEVKIISTDDLKKVLTKSDDTTRVINFWATWCKPCVDELPYFVRATDEMKDKNIEFIFVSVDFQSVHASVEAKAKDLGLKGTLFHLNAQGNEWIDDVDKDWSGAIPFTLLISSDGKKATHYDQFDSFESLKTFLNTNTSN